MHRKSFRFLAGTHADVAIRGREEGGKMQTYYCFARVLRAGVSGALHDSCLNMSITTHGTKAD